MPYIKQGFTKGQTLKADHLNYIEDGIANHTHSYNDLADRTHYVGLVEGTETRKFEAVNQYGGSITDLEFAKLLVENCDTAIYNFSTNGVTYSNYQFVSITDVSENEKRITVKVYGTFYVDVNLSTGYIQVGDGGRGMFNDGTITVSCMKEDVVQLDEKFIPETIARVSDVPEQVQSDWDEEDETSPAFILNKPTSIGGGGYAYYYVTTKDPDGCVHLFKFDSPNENIIPSYENYFDSVTFSEFKKDYDTRPIMLRIFDNLGESKLVPLISLLGNYYIAYCNIKTGASIGSVEAEMVVLEVTFKFESTSTNTSTSTSTTTTTTSTSTSTSTY